MEKQTQLHLTSEDSQYKSQYLELIPDSVFKIHVLGW